jgi:hypothetical protein
LIKCLEYINCSLTEHGIVLNQVEQFDVLDLYKTCIIIRLILGQLMEKYIGLIKMQLY